MTAPSCGAVTIAAKPSECCQTGKGAVANKKEDAINVTDKGSTIRSHTTVFLTAFCQRFLCEKRAGDIYFRPSCFVQYTVVVFPGRQ